MKIRCAWGMHDDRIDGSGYYSPTCSRCGGPSCNGPTSRARGSVLLMTGTFMILVSLLTAPDPVNELITVILGGVLVGLGTFMVWRQKL